MASGAMARASRVFVIGREMRERVSKVFGSVPGIDAKMKELNLGADTSLFEPITRASRAGNISEMLGLVRDVPRGKTYEMTEALFQKFSGSMTLDEMLEAINSSETSCFYSSGES
jgi:hypothetical protein